MATFSSVKNLFKFTTDYCASQKSDIHRASIEGNVELLKSCLEKDNVEIDIEDDNGKTPLYMAVQYNHINVMKLLIKHGANVNPRNCVPLNIVRYTQEAQILLEAGALVNARDDIGNSPLHRAVVRRNDELVEFLLKCGSDITAVNENGMNPLHEASKYASDKDCLNIVKQLVEKKCPINATDNLKRTPLHLACQNTDTCEIIGLLLEHGASEMATDFKCIRPIHYLLEQFYMVDMDKLEVFLESVRKLLQNKDSSLTTDSSGKTPLHYAAGKTNDKVVSLILSQGNYSNKTDGFGRIPLHYSCTMLISNELIGAGSDVNKQDRWGISPIQTAIERKDIDNVNLLLSSGVHMEQRDEVGRTVLHSAASVGSVEIVELILNRGISVNITDKYFNTALHLAAWNDHVDVVSLLIDHKADPFMKDANKNSTQEICAYRSEGSCDVFVQYTDMFAYSVRFKRFSNYANKLMTLEDLEHVIQSDDNIKRSDEDVSQYILSLLHTPTIGFLDYEEEVKEIQTVVKEMMINLADIMGKTDSRFKCKVLHVGSTAEGTKVRCPDEFDFILCLEHFSENSYPEFKEKNTLSLIEADMKQYQSSKDAEPEHLEVSIAGYVLIKSDNKHYTDIVSEFAYGRGTISCLELNYNFSQLLTAVLFSETFPSISPLIISEVTLNPTIVLKWRGCTYKDLTINIDVVPAIKLASWPERFEKTSILITNEMLQIPCLAVPKMTSSQDEDLWRCSMVLMEIAIFRNLLPHIRNSYVAAKVLMSSYVCPLVSFNDDEDAKLYFRHQKRTQNDDEDDDDDFNLYESVEHLTPSYLLKMSFFTAIEQKAVKDGLDSVYTKLVKLENSDSDICATDDERIYGPVVTTLAPNNSSNIDLELTKEIFHILQKNLQDKFIPSFFNQKQNILSKELLSGDAEKVYKYTTFILKLLL